MKIRSILMLGYMFGFLWLRRNLLSMIWLFSTPFTILFLFYVIAGASALPTALVGAYVMLFVGAGISIMGDAVWSKRELKYQDVLVASTVSSYEYMAGLAFAELFFSLPGIVIILIPLLLINPTTYSIITIFTIPTVTWLLVSSMSFYFSTHVPNTRNGWQISMLLNLVLTILPPIFYPIEVIPPLLRPLAYIVPTTHSALLLKASLGIISLSLFDIMFSWSYLLLFFIISTAVAMRKAQWRDR